MYRRELSGRKLTRAAIATVFANDAKVLLLDEPFGALVRMMAVALFFLLYASVRFFITDRLSRRLVAWTPHTPAEGRRA